MKDIVKRLPESTDKCQYCGSCRLVRPSGKWQFNCECDNPEKRPKKPEPEFKENRMKDLIEKLKDKTFVRAFGLMEETLPGSQECFRKVGKKNCLQFYATWENPGFGDFNEWDTYAIKPDYQPEPEPSPVDLEIVQGGDWLGVHRVDAEGRVVLPHGFTHLHCLPSLPKFEGFYLKDGDEVSVEYEWVARYFPNVIARFRI